MTLLCTFALIFATQSYGADQDCSIHILGAEPPATNEQVEHEQRAEDFDSILSSARRPLYEVLLPLGAEVVQNLKTTIDRWDVSHLSRVYMWYSQVPELKLDHPQQLVRIVHRLDKNSELSGRDYLRLLVSIYFWNSVPGSLNRATESRLKSLIEKRKSILKIEILNSPYTVAVLVPPIKDRRVYESYWKRDLVPVEVEALTSGDLESIDRLSAKLKKVDHFARVIEYAYDLHMNFGHGFFGSYLKKAISLSHLEYKKRIQAFYFYMNRKIGKEFSLVKRNFYRSLIWYTIAELESLTVAEMIFWAAHDNRKLSASQKASHKMWLETLSAQLTHDLVDYGGLYRTDFRPAILPTSWSHLSASEKSLRARAWIEEFVNSIGQ